MDITVRYFAAAAEAAGTQQEILSLEGTVGDLKSYLVTKYGTQMNRVVSSGSFLIDGVVSRDETQCLSSRVDVLPPFAGG